MSKISLKLFCVLFQNIFSRINVTFKKSLRQQLINLNVRNNGGPQHGLVYLEMDIVLC